jgi:hypothetical protein
VRDSSQWHRGVTKQLARVWKNLPPQAAGVTPLHVVQAELVLRLLARVAPGAAPRGAYTLLGGYPFARAQGFDGPETRAMIAAARHLLWTLRRRRSWEHALESYLLVPERLRLYDIPEDSGPAVELQLTVAEDRVEVYDRALAALPPFRSRPLPTASPGRSSFTERRRAAWVQLPASLSPVRAKGHSLTVEGAGRGEPFRITRRQLAETAHWMDEAERAAEVERPGNWKARLDELKFAPRSTCGRDFTDDDTLTIDGRFHMVGMVGAGKSTFMVLLAAWCARNGRRITLVVGDVAEQLRLTGLFRAIGLSATPVLGPTTRETHVQRLHRRLATRGFDNLLDHDDPGFDDLSTVCVVDALRGTEAAQPLRYADAPCTTLYPEADTEAAVATQDVPELPAPYMAATEPTPSDGDADERPKGEPHGCPIWSACPRHRSARDLVDAPIWVANPASLVQTAVPRNLNDEQVRYLELACLRSDIVIVDEADSVQMKLDEMFAPSATLIKPGLDSWFDLLHTHKIGELSLRGRRQLTDPDIARWSSALSVVSTAADPLYRRLISDPELCEWVETEYFSPWTLQEKLLADWFADRDTPTDEVPDEHALYEAYETDQQVTDTAAAAEAPADARRTVLTAIFDAFRDDPLGGRGPYGNATDDLVRATEDVLHTLAEVPTRRRIHALARALLADTPAPVDDPQWFETNCHRLEFMLILTVLHHRLERLTFLWPQVEAALRLDSTGNELSRRPPLDYAPVVPEAPMGNVLGFQYLVDDRDHDDEGRRSGTLRFFRCAGVGRELLLGLDRLGADPGQGRAGPHVVLMSGTSWAGTSTRAHVAAPVGAVLKPSDRSLAAVRRTVFRTRFLYDDEGRPMSLSGTDPKVRPAVARAMVTRLGSPGVGGSLSPLEHELALVDDDNRRRAILLVGSYKEAELAADVLHGIERWHGRVRVLAADDAELDQARGRDPDDGSSERAAALRRGDLAMFAEDPAAEVLVAPLMAVERGHNILNTERNAAFGTALFLARPHPRPDDLALAVYAINDWVVRFTRDEPKDGSDGLTFAKLVADAGDLDAAGLAFRYKARAEWRRLLSRRYVYSRLTPAEKRSFAWDQLVTLWQVIGRLVRGGVPARVVFVDARFAPGLARRLAPGSTPLTTAPVADDGLLNVLRTILDPYFAEHAASQYADSADPALVRLLYQPLYDALCGLTHHT